MTASAPSSPESSDGSPASVWPRFDKERADTAQLTRVIGWIAATIALIVAVAMPVGYFWVSLQAEQRESAIAARLHAAFISQAIATANGDWHDDAIDLIGTDLAPSRLPEQRLLLDSQGQPVDGRGKAVEWPMVRQSAPLVMRQGAPGSVEVRRSLAPLLVNTLVIAALAALLGAAIFISLRLRVLWCRCFTVSVANQRLSWVRQDAETGVK